MDQFEALLASSKTAVERWVRSRLSSSADAEDILQETYLAAFQGFSALRNPDAFLPWILGIARRKYADWYRVQARRKEILMEHLPETAEDSPEDDAVEETLNTLPERDRLMLRLFYQEMLSQKQISVRLQIPEGIPGIPGGQETGSPLHIRKDEASAIRLPRCGFGAVKSYFTTGTGEGQT